MSLQAEAFRREDGPERLREHLDARIRVHAGLLGKLDRTVRGFSVTAKATIAFEPSARALNGLSQEELAAFSPIKALLDERSASLTRRVEETQRQAGVLDAKHVLGALVVVFDSSKRTPACISGEREAGTRGFHQAQNDERLGVVAVDINPSLRDDGVDGSATLVHELHHHLLSLSDLAVGLDPQLGFATAAKTEHHNDLLERRKGVRFRSSWERLHADRAMISALEQEPLPQEPNVATMRAAERFSDQRAYLDELHSSFLQRKGTWFGAANEVYSAHRKGRHEEVVGGNERDRGATKDLLCLLQGMLAASFFHDHLKNLGDGPRLDLFRRHPGAELFFHRFPQAYDHFGALIGSSRSIHQARRLCLQAWKELLRIGFLKRNLKPGLDHIAKTPGFAAVSSTGEAMETFVLRD